MANRLMPVEALLNPALTDKQLTRIEDTMNATIREAVFVTELLDSGDIEAAKDALIQIKLNAEQINTLVERLEKKGINQLKREAARG